MTVADTWDRGSDGHVVMLTQGALQPADTPWQRSAVMVEKEYRARPSSGGVPNPLIERRGDSKIAGIVQLMQGFRGRKVCWIR